jgi:hypothetical protein
MAVRVNCGSSATSLTRREDHPAACLAAHHAIIGFGDALQGTVSFLERTLVRASLSRNCYHAGLDTGFWDRLAVSAEALNVELDGFLNTAFDLRTGLASGDATRQVRDVS